MTAVLEALLWSLLSFFGMSSTACAFWGALNTAAVDGNVDHVMRTAETSINEQLVATASAAEAAIALDRFGARWMRTVTGFPSDPYTQAVMILGPAQATVQTSWSEAQRVSTFVPRGARPLSDTQVVSNRMSRLIRSVVGAMADTTRETLALQPVPDKSGALSPEQAAERLVGRLTAAHAAAADAHIRVRHLLLRTLFWTLVSWSLASLALTTLLTTAVAVHRLAPPAKPPTAMPLAPRHRPVRLVLGPANTALAAALTAEGVPARLAQDISAWLSRARQMPGSLKGHDRVEAGLATHTLAVVRALNRLAAEALPRDRALAATLAASHDLGKILSYHEDDYGTWTSHSAVPHDSLGAQVLALSPSLRDVFSAPEIEDLLLALHTEHAPDLVPANCRPRVHQLLAWLKQADAEVAGRPVASAPTAATAEVAEEELHNA